jgi:glycosyltransferase involved in cell wall biosynthesis
MRLLIVVNVDWFFLSHRLEVALGALRAGHEVHVATTLSRARTQLEEYGFVVHPLEVDRSSAGPIGLIKLFFDLLSLFWRLRPDVLHLITIKPVLIGGVAARLSPVRGVVYAVSGLGHVFLAYGRFGKIRRKIVGIWYRFALHAENMRIIFQNPDDRHEIESVISLRDDQVVLIPGSGVNLSKYQARPLPDGEAVVLMAARLLSTKGVREYVAAAQRLRALGVEARFWLAGDSDPANPANIQAQELDAWGKQGTVQLLGHRSNIPVLMSQAHIVVLPSYREGLPKVLIEAAACGRVVVATDVPGCRDAIEKGVTGLLVPSRDTESLADAIRRLVEDRALCDSMGRAGRRRAERLFDVNAVVSTHLEIYRALGTRL